MRAVKFDFRSKTCIMGVLNVTPDSFYDGGRFLDKAKAIEHAIQMARDGADIIDVGGESSRPGASGVSESEEIERVIPVIENISNSLKIPISIDTRKSKVAEEAINAGATIVNDVSGLRHDPEIASIAARHSVYLILMHMKGTPKDMQVNPTYENLIEEIIDYLRESIDIAKSSGVREENIIIDPGIGFGKTVEHNLEILNRLDEFKVFARPICVGISRKSFIGKVLGLDSPEDRLAGTLGVSAIAIMNGANILRAHDVRETRQVAQMADRILGTANILNHAEVRR